MEHHSGPVVQSVSMQQFARIMEPTAFVSRELPVSSAGAGPATSRPAKQSARLNLQQENVRNGLGQLVLTLVKLLHELLERQAIRRVEAGSLSDAEVERLGTTLMRQAEEIDRLRQVFKLEEEDLNLDLGPLGRLL